MAFCKNHDHIYFDKLCRTKKSETVLSLIYATYLAKINEKDISKQKKEIANHLVDAYRLFKFDSGTYEGSEDQFESQYTIGHELGIWKNSNLDLTPLAESVAEGRITIKDYFDIVFLNYIQPINGNIEHLLYKLVKYMKDNNIKSVKKDDIRKAFLPINNENEHINSLYNMLIGTSYFSVIDGELYLNYNYNDILECCNMKYSDKSYDDVRKELDNLDIYLGYLLEDRRSDALLIKRKNQKYIVVEENEQDLSIEQLASILKNMYSKGSNKVAAVIMFGIKYGRIIKKLEYDSVTIITASGLTDSYKAELQKGLKLFEALDSNEYNVRFYDSIEKNSGLKSIDYTTKEKFGTNYVYYGAPGCGKSYYIKEDLKTMGVNEKENVVRVTFHPEYSNSDFVGQILPIIKKDENGKEIVTYAFNPGPFSIALKKALLKNEMIYLIIEELNRGNAAAIFGDIFQLLDRVTDDKKDNYCSSEYPIKNPNIENYLRDELYKEGYDIGDDYEIAIPGNLTIIATMNSSDQNVFTLDTAFKRRWNFKQLPNDIVNDERHPYKKYYIPGTEVTWERFLVKINKEILKFKIQNQTNEDKRLGKYFVNKECLTDTPKNINDAKREALEFAYKVLEYIWDDVCKIGREEWFNVDKYQTLEELINAFICPENGNPLSIFENIENWD